MSEVELFLPADAVLGESPTWDDASSDLLFADIARNELHRLNTRDRRHRVRSFGGPVAAIGLAREGGMVLGVGHHLQFLAAWSDAAIRLVTLPSGDRANDGGCDPRGRFLVGTMTHRRDPGACGLYRLDRLPDGWSMTPLIHGVTLSNGFDWSPGGELLYFVDTPTLRVDVLDYDMTTGSVSSRRPFVDLADSLGRPDGLTVDCEGGVWVAVVRGGEVRRYTPAGSLDAVYRVPVPWVTSMAFGGPKLDELYVTTARDPERRGLQPGAGGVYRVRPGVKGRPPTLWSGAAHAASAE